MPAPPRRAAWANSSRCTSSRARTRAWKRFCQSANPRHRAPASSRTKAVMILARVVRTVVATRKAPRLEGKKLLILKPVSPEGKDESGYVVSVDTVSAGFKEKVIAVSGSSARMAEGCKDVPVDMAIVGIVDDVQLDEK